MSVLADGLRLAVGTLTVFPVSPPRQVVGSVAGVAMVTAPIAVLPVAAAAAAAVWASDTVAMPSLVTAALAVGVLAAGTGMIHLDGLADTVDGLAAGGPRERRLEVMRRSDIGPSGSTALLILLLVQIGALAGLVAELGTAAASCAMVVSVLVSRSVLVLACTRGIPAARPDGLGSAVAGTVPPLVALLVGAVVAVGATLCQGWSGLTGLLVATAAVALVLLQCRRRLGGVSGDVLGACVEVAFAAYLLAQVGAPPMA